MTGEGREREQFFPRPHMLWGGPRLSFPPWTVHDNSQASPERNVPSSVFPPSKVSQGSHHSLLYAFTLAGSRMRWVPFQIAHLHPKSKVWVRHLVPHSPMPPISRLHDAITSDMGLMLSFSAEPWSAFNSYVQDSWLWPFIYKPYISWIVSPRSL